MHNMEPMSEFSLDHLRTSQIIPAYMHDGSEYGADEFEMKITDGRHVSKKLLVSIYVLQCYLFIGYFISV